MIEASDKPLIDFLRRRGPATIAELGIGLKVTATAVRHHLARLAAAGLVDRLVEHQPRGRPKHRYQISSLAQKTLGGQNYADLATVLWDELMSEVADRKLRRQLFLRITDRLAEIYRAEVNGQDWNDRLTQLNAALAHRGIESEVARGAGDEAFLRQYSCPYLELAESDPAICALERKMFEKVLGRGLRLAQCRLDGHNACDFEAKPLIDQSVRPVVTIVPKHAV
jgi:predicted ArsR family transcriptional regulator